RGRVADDGHGPAGDRRGGEGVPVEPGPAARDEQGAGRRAAVVLHHGRALRVAREARGPHVAHGVGGARGGCGQQGREAHGPQRTIGGVSPWRSSRSRTRARSRSSPTKSRSSPGTTTTGERE